MEITFELMTMAQVPISAIEKELLQILKGRAWFVPTEAIIIDHLIKNEFFIMMEEIEDIANDPDRTDYVRGLASQMYNALPDVTYVQVIDQ